MPRDLPFTLDGTHNEKKVQSTLKRLLSHGRTIKKQKAAVCAEQTHTLKAKQHSKIVSTISDFMTTPPAMPQMEKYIREMEESIPQSTEAQTKLRSSFVRYLQAVQSVYPVSVDTFCLIMQLFDQFHRARPSSGQDKTEQLYSLGIITVGYKLLETQPLSLECLHVSLGMRQFSKEQIKQAEVEVVQAVAFRLEQNNYYDCLKNLLLRFAPLQDPSSEERLKRIVVAVQQSQLVVTHTPFYLGFAIFYLAIKIQQSHNTNKISVENRLQEVIITLGVGTRIDVAKLLQTGQGILNLVDQKI